MDAMTIDLAMNARPRVNKAAEVAIDGRIYAFTPAEMKAGYTAKRIDARCIELQHSKFPQKLCSDR